MKKKNSFKDIKKKMVKNALPMTIIAILVLVIFFLGTTKKENYNNQHDAPKHNKRFDIILTERLFCKETERTITVRVIIDRMNNKEMVIVD